MGMFDYIRCKYPLPVAGANDTEFQTKDTPAQYLDHYEISETGELLHETYDTVDRSDPNATGLNRIFGIMSRENKKWEPVESFTGEIRFYSDDFEFSAYFEHGKLVRLNQIAP
jgi:hypothetical protein